MKKFVTLLISLTVLLSCLTPAALGAGGVSVRVDDKPVVWTDAAPFISGDGRTLVPLRAVADAMGLDVVWDGNTRTAIFSESGTSYEGRCPWTNTLRFPIDSAVAYGEAAANWVNSEPDIVYENVYMDTAAVIVNGRTYAPIRYLAEFFGWSVLWTDAVRTVDLVRVNSPHGVNYVSPASYGGDNALVGTWEVDTSDWAQRSVMEMGMVQDTVKLIFQPGGRMAYHVFDTLYEGTYALNIGDTGTQYAVASLENGWSLDIDLLNMAMSVAGLPTITRETWQGDMTTNIWGFYRSSLNTSIGLDPWFQ